MYSNSEKKVNPKKDSTLSQLSQERTTESNAIQIPQVSLPKGGGALRGIDEKFQVNPVNGTSSFSIPLPLSPNRNGFTPCPTILVLGWLIWHWLGYGFAIYPTADG